MKAKFLVFATLLLGACGNQDAQQTIDLEDFNTAESKNLFVIHHYSLPLDGAAVAGGQGDGEELEDSKSHGHSTENEVEISTENMEYSETDTSAIEEITGQADDIHAEITTVWNDAFVPMYQSYYGYDISTEYVASELQSLQESYSQLESEVRKIKNPSFLSVEHSGSVEALKSDLTLAISNRSLALIEFEQMNNSKNEKKRDELLNIHVENSGKYLGRAENHLDELKDLDAENHSGKEDELVTANE